MNTLFPIFLDLREKKCLVVGAGSVALRKIHDLLSCGAQLAVVASESNPLVRALHEEGRIALVHRSFCDEDVAGAVLVIASTDDEEVNRAVHAAAKKAGALCNVVDVPELCDFHVPAQVVRDDLKIAVSTGGRAPAFGARVRSEIEALFPGRYAEALRVVAEIRDRILSDPGLAPEERREAILKAVHSENMDRFLKGRIDELDPETLS